MPTISQDVLFFTLAICAVVLTTLLSCVLYYILMGFKDIRTITHTFRRRIEELMKYIDKAKGKAEAAALATTTIGKAAFEIFDYLKKKRPQKGIHIRVTKKKKNEEA